MVFQTMELGSPQFGKPWFLCFFLFFMFFYGFFWFLAGWVPAWAGLGCSSIVWKNTFFFNFFGFRLAGLAAGWLAAGWLSTCLGWAGLKIVISLSLSLSPKLQFLDFGERGSHWRGGRPYIYIYIYILFVLYCFSQFSFFYHISIVFYYNTI